MNPPHRIPPVYQIFSGWAAWQGGYSEVRSQESEYVGAYSYTPYKIGNGVSSIISLIFIEDAPTERLYGVVGVR
jgi:hypothetical protein